MSYYHPKYENVSFEELKDKLFSKVEGSSGGDEIKFFTTDGDEYLMMHEQDCCESVYIESIVGDLQDLVGSTILLAEESSNSGTTGEYGDSFTYTFYKLATIKGYVDIRWYGSSNGYYSEGVSLLKLKKG